MFRKYKDSQVYLVNEGNMTGNVTASIKVYDDASNLIGEQTRTLATSYRNTVKAFDLKEYDGRPHFVALEITDENGNGITDNFYCIAAQRNSYDWDEYTWYDTPITSYSDLRFAFAQPEADVQMETSYDDGTYTVVLKNNSPVISYMNILKAKDEKGGLVVPAYWSDNFFPLLPGQTRTVTCKTGLEGVNIELDN